MVWYSDPPSALHFVNCIYETWLINSGEMIENSFPEYENFRVKLRLFAKKNNPWAHIIKWKNQIFHI